jgi:hypothetical protein
MIFFFFLKRGQKLCPNLLIKKERIAQLINGKLSENRYNNTTSNTEDPDQQKPPTYNYNKQTTTERAPHRKRDQLNEPTNLNGYIKQAAAETSRRRPSSFFWS